MRLSPLKNPIDLVCALLLVGLLTSSCAVRTAAPLRAWDGETKNLPLTTQQCVAKGQIVIRIQGEKELKADFRLRYRRLREELSMIVLGPLGDIQARLELSKKSKVWKDAHATIALSEHPIASPFFEGPWPNQIDFMLGIRDPKQRNQIFLDAQGDPNIWVQGSRQIRCADQKCNLTDQNTRAKLDFASVVCRDSLY